MIRDCKYIGIIFLVLIINSCSNKDDNITNPNINSIYFGDTTNAILLSSFEFNGRSDLEGWQPKDSISNVEYSFSTDVPNVGGNWSFQLKAIAYNAVGFDTTIELSTSDSLNNYILTFWAKGKGNLFFDLHTSDGGVGITKPIDCTSWTFFSDTLYRFDVQLNKLSVLLTSSVSDSLSNVFYDNIKVVVKPQ